MDKKADFLIFKFQITEIRTFSPFVIYSYIFLIIIINLPIRYLILYTHFLLIYSSPNLIPSAFIPIHHYYFYILLYYSLNTLWHLLSHIIIILTFLLIYTPILQASKPYAICFPALSSFLLFYFYILLYYLPKPF